MSLAARPEDADERTYTHCRKCGTTLDAKPERKWGFCAHCYGVQDRRLPHRVSEQMCLDGVARTDCVVIVETRGTAMGEEIRCGKPMVGLVPFVMGSWMRMCEDCFQLFTHNLEGNFGVRL